MRLLDIIVTHYNEPFETGRKFFEMLALQRCINFNDFRVLLVNDGSDNALDESYFLKYPYQVDILTVNHGGVSAARNAGLERACAKWVNFCDFDDMYASVFSLRQVFNVLDSDGFDILYADFISEDKLKNGKVILHNRGENLVFIHAKYWRLEWLKQTGLKFNTTLEFNEDSAFCAMASNLVDYKRTGRIDTSIPIYVWCFTENSATTTPGNRIKCLVGLYKRNKVVCEQFKNMEYSRYCAMVSRTIHDAYWSFNLVELPKEAEQYLEDFKQFWRDHKRQFLDTDPQTMREVAQASQREHDIGDAEEEERFLHANTLCVNKNISLAQWLHNLEKG